MADRERAMEGLVEADDGLAWSDARAVGDLRLDQRLAGPVFDSHAAPTVFASVFVDAISDARGPDGQAHLEVLEEFADRRGTFVD